MRFFQKIRQNWKKSVGILFNKILLPRNEFFCKNHHHNRLSIANCYNFCTNFLVNLRYTGVQIQSQFLASIMTNHRRWVKIMYLGSKTTNFCRFGPKVHDFCRKMNSLQLCSYKRLAHKAPFGHYKLFTAQISMWD